MSRELPIELTSSASVTSSPITTMLNSRATTLRGWATKRSVKNDVNRSGTAATDSQGSSSSASMGTTSSTAVKVVIVAALTAATASIAYSSYQVLSRRAGSRRSRPALGSRQPVGLGGVSSPVRGISIATEGNGSAPFTLVDAAKSVARTGWPSGLLQGCGSVAAHCIAPSNVFSAPASDRALGQNCRLEGGARVNPLISTQDMDAVDATPVGDGRASSAEPCRLSSQLASATPSGIGEERITPAAPAAAAAAAAPSLPCPEAPKVLLSNFYDLEPYTLHGIAGGAHGWRRVFGLLKSETRVCTGKDYACSDGGRENPAVASGCRVPLSLTRTYEGVHTTTSEYPVLVQDVHFSISPSAQSTTKSSLPRIASTGGGVCSSSTARSDLSVHSDLSGQSIGSLAEMCARQGYGHAPQCSSSRTASSVSTRTPTDSLHPSRFCVSPAAGALSPSGGLVDSFSLHVRQHLNDRMSCSMSRSTNSRSTTHDATFAAAGSRASTSFTPGSVSASAALAMSERNLQRDISSLVATAASARPMVSASSSVSGSHVDTVRCSAISSVVVSPRDGAMACCASKQLYLPLMSAGSWSQLTSSIASSSRGIGQQKEDSFAMEGKEAAEQHAAGSPSRAKGVSRGPQQVVSSGPSSASSNTNPRRPCDDFFRVDANATGGVADACGPAVRQAAERESARSPSLTSKDCAAPIVTSSDAWPLPAPPEATSTEASAAAATSSTGCRASPLSTIARRCTIAEQLAVLTSRRERQIRYAQQLQASRGSAGLGGGVTSSQQPVWGTLPPPVSTDVLADVTSSRTKSFSTSDRGQGLSGACCPYSRFSQYHTDTPPGMFCSSLLHAHHYQNQVYSDVTAEVQQCARRRQKKWGTVHRSCSTTVPMPSIENDDSAAQETCTRMAEKEIPAAAAAAVATSASPRLSRERPAAEANLSAVVHTAAARRAATSGVCTPYCTTGASNVPLLSQPTPLQPSNERRVDDLTVKHQENGSASYTISLTYHDSESGTPRTVNTCALPPLRRGDAGAPIPGLSSFSGGAVKPASLRAKPVVATTSVAPSATSDASLTDSCGLSCGAVAQTGSPESLLEHPHNVIKTLKPLPCSPLSRAPDAESEAPASGPVGPIHSRRAGGVKLVSAVRSSGSLDGCPKCCGSLAAAGEANRSPVGDVTTTSASDKVHPFAAPLPPSEPQHGPRLQGVAGRNGEMAIGAFLGGGACGKVYECLNTETGQVLAAKQIVFDAKDRRLRARLRQLELELEVLTLAARHHVPWIVGFYGAEKRGHSVLMYLEYCQRGSLLDYMMGEGDNIDLGMCCTHSPCSGVIPPPLTAPRGRGVGCGLDMKSGTSVAAVEAWQRDAACVDGPANTSITESIFENSRESCASPAHTAAVPVVTRQESLPLPLLQRSGDAEPAASETDQKEEGEETTAATGHIPIPHRTCRGDGEDGECAVRRGGTFLAKTAASVSSAEEYGNLSTSTWDMIQLSEAPQPQMPLLTIQQVQRFTKEIVSGLYFLHQHNYAHLDVKTANVLVTADEQCRLADFGCAMRLQPSSQQPGAPVATECAMKARVTGSLDDALSQTPPYPVLVDRDAITELRGTALYMAPEMIRFESHAIGSPADLWSLGCVVMEMSTGCAPWRHIAKDKLRVLYRIGSARDELPLPPLMHAWAEKATERLAQVSPPEAPAAWGSQNSLAACKPLSDDTARAPHIHSAVKKERDSAVSEELCEPSAKFCRVEYGRCEGADTSSAAAVRCIGEQQPSLFDHKDTCSGVSMRCTPLTCAHADSPVAGFTRTTPAASPGLVGRSASYDERAAVSDTEEPRFSECRTMRLYVELLSFVAACVKVRPEDRSSAEQLLRHPFLNL